jgi:mono/diheme cytochrome c family protein
MKTLLLNQPSCLPGFIILCLLGAIQPAFADSALSKADSEFFESKIRPLLADNCLKCHSSEAPKLKGGLSLEFKESILTGGDTGPAIVPGTPEKSLLIKAVRYTDPDLQMPPKNKKLSDAQIADLVEWVKRGAPDPRSVKAVAGGAKKDAKNHWSFQPVKKPAVPVVQNQNWCATPVDNFIVAKLAANGMKPNAPADKRALLRRATFDLTGLPPTQQEVDNFMFDDSPNAFEKVVDRLLASPAYGERWGRYWLDIARYSDTKGDVKRQRESFLNPYAYTYRDYVIRAFNEDKPYNQFIVEQIAADKLRLNNNSNLAALGFLTVGDHFNGMNNDIINDRIDVVTKGFLGLTVTCARCHDHKFDPIPTADYYSLRGIFNSSVEPKDGPLLAPIHMSDEFVKFDTEYKKKDAELAELRSQRPAQMTGEQRKLWIREQTRLVQEIGQLEMTAPGVPARAMVVVDTMKGQDSPIFIRGEQTVKGETVPRRFLEVLSGPRRPAFTNGSGRLDLAACIANPGNPLTARVIVNRVWQHHFGEGFVPTPDDLGTQSEPPSHPELLDYLATRFMADGWSLKKLHKLIMLSSVYQQSSDTNPKFAELDPNNRLLWRANIQRLDLEAVRDSVLAIGGSLDHTMGGRPVKLGTLPYSTRRTIYGYIDRQNLPEIFTQFDFANPTSEAGKRYETIVPQQALFLMNSPIVIEQARKLTESAAFAKLADDDARVRFLYEHIYQRVPTITEIKLGKEFITASPPPEPLQAIAYQTPERPKPGQNLKQQQKRPQTFSSVPVSGRHPLESWDKYAHALLQANETMFIN